MSGLGAAFIVGISRAVGETMVVAIAAGSGPATSPAGRCVPQAGCLQPVRVRRDHDRSYRPHQRGDLSYDSIDYNSIFAIALLLFLITLALNIISQWIVRRYRMKY